MLLKARAEEIVSLTDKTVNQLLSLDEIIVGDVYIGCGETEGMNKENPLSKKKNIYARSIIFPFAIAALYLILFYGGNTLFVTIVLIILWGLLGGINANINQFWISRAAPEAPDFANGLFLTAANLGCVLGTAFGGLFIDGFGMASVVLGGILFSLGAAVILLGQCYRPAMNPLGMALAKVDG